MARDLDLEEGLGGKCKCDDAQNDSAPWERQESSRLRSCEYRVRARVTTEHPPPKMCAIESTLRPHRWHGHTASVSEKHFPRSEVGRAFSVSKNW